MEDIIRIYVKTGEPHVILNKEKMGGIEAYAKEYLNTKGRTKSGQI